MTGMEDLGKKTIISARSNRALMPGPASPTARLNTPLPDMRVNIAT